LLRKTASSIISLIDIMLCYVRGMNKTITEMFKTQLKKQKLNKIKRTVRASSTNPGNKRMKLTTTRTNAMEHIGRNHSTIKNQTQRNGRKTEGR